MGSTAEGSATPNPVVGAAGKAAAQEGAPNSLDAEPAGAAAAGASAGGPTPLAVGIQYFPVAVVVSFFLRLWQGGFLNANPHADDIRMCTLMALLATAIALFTMLTVQLRLVLRPGGELAKLQVLRPLVRASSVRPLSLLRSKLRALKMAFRFVGLMCSLWGVGSGLGGYGLGAGLMWVSLGAWAWAAGTLVLDFVLSLQVGAALASDAVLDVVQAVRTTAPVATDGSDEAWESRVERPALMLPQGAIQVLSDGWGPGLGLAYVANWLMALMFLVFFDGIISGFMFFEGEVAWVTIVLLFVATFLYMPMAMSRGVADVSDSCDDLVDSINERRLEDLSRNTRLWCLELALKNLNIGQGRESAIDKQ
eukprot:SAG22_NODE_13_length_33548_cov_57.167773_5_plen_366_part_00